MPHQCVRCSRIYPDGSNELLNGCNCGGKFFFFVKASNLEEAKKITDSLSIADKRQIENDVLEIVGNKIDKKKPIVLDLESIKVLKPGKYELDLVDLFRGKPLVYKLEDGKYIIDVASTFQAKELDIPEQKDAKLNQFQEEKEQEIEPEEKEDVEIIEEESEPEEKESGEDFIA